MQLLGVLLCVAISTAMSIDNPERAVDEKTEEKRDNSDKYEILLNLLKKGIDEINLRKEFREIEAALDSGPQHTRGEKRHDVDAAAADAQTYGEYSPDVTTGRSDAVDVTTHLYGLLETQELRSTDGHRETHHHTSSSIDAKAEHTVAGKEVTELEKGDVTTAYAVTSTSATPTTTTKSGNDDDDCESENDDLRPIENKSDKKGTDGDGDGDGDGEGLDMGEMIAKGERLERQLRVLFHDLKSASGCTRLNRICDSDKECCKGLKCDGKARRCVPDCVEFGESCRDNYFCCGHHACIMKNDDDDDYICQ